MLQPEERGAVPLLAALTASRDRKTSRAGLGHCLRAPVQVDMGLNPYLIDKAIAGKFGMPMGPFR